MVFGNLLEKIFAESQSGGLNTPLSGGHFGIFENECKKKLSRKNKIATQKNKHFRFFLKINLKIHSQPNQIQIVINTHSLKGTPSVNKKIKKKYPVMVKLGWFEF